MLSAMILGFLVSELRHRGFDGWLWSPILYDAPKVTVEETAGASGEESRKVGMNV
jgi:hypothetical protein